MKLRPEVQRFAERMELKLRKHDKDRGDSWRTMFDEDVWDFIERELEELRKVRYCQPQQSEERALECADVANGLMFLAEKRHPVRVGR